ncbi:hypothetical protein DXN05_11040 [Deminuibacter soli]|uniref:Lipopolysaccharide-assembly n=2 Tax=Deminuibacter soli TaxID=2291815 RepID=A0A3E1NJR3_9BACT|nr:hypothetical protein DXN05_11040 [Deminuibacter soli]
MTRFARTFLPRPLVLVLLAVVFTGLSGCGVYSFKDVSYSPAVKTIKINLFQNKAGYVNPQLAPRLTEGFSQKVSNQTRLTRTTNDDAHYQVSATIVSYRVTTSAISNQQAATNRLTVAVHVEFKNTLDPSLDNNKTRDFDVSRDFEFSANLTLNQVEAQSSFFDDLVKNMSDEIFNRIFSNW